ncbi:MAG: aldo/keto reductase [Nanoarchaeota archaeon]|nr:aldo/keto reductase [Nanoarchaeota archaeon]
MEFIEIEPGKRIPAIGLGTFRLAGKGCIDTVKNAISLGYRYIDTAQYYGNEKNIGQAVKESGISRKEIFLSTKIHWDNMDSKKQAYDSVIQSLADLGTDYIDILLIHWPKGDIKETLHAMIQLQHESKTKFIGVSNFTVQLLEEALKIAPDIAFNQIEYHPLLSQDKVIGYCKANGIRIIAYSPLAEGSKDILNNPVLENIGKRYQKTSAQIALRWVIQQEGVIAIPKAASIEHLQENIDIFDFKLKENEMAEIFGLHKGLRVLNPEHLAPEWD